MSTINKANRNSFENNRINHSKHSLYSNGVNSSAFQANNNPKKSKQHNGNKTQSAEPTTSTLSNPETAKSLEEQFKAACDAIQNLPKNGPFQPSNEMLLKFYGYFKQATVGPNPSKKPSMFKVVERAKWDAHNSVRDLTKQEAMQGYIDEIKHIIETMPHNESVNRLIAAIGPFYEFIDDVDNSENESSESELETAHLATLNSSDDNDSNKQSIENGASMTSSYDMVTSATFNNQLNNHKDLNLNVNIENINHTNGGESNGLTLSNGNGYMNGNGLYTNNNKYVSDDEDEEENYCDTSDNLNEHDLLVQTVKLQQIVKNGLKQTYDPPKNNGHIENALNGNHDFNHNHVFSNLNGSLLNNSDYEINSILVNSTIKGQNGHHKDNHTENFNSIINKCGGEVNSPQSNAAAFSSNQMGSQQQARQSRPGSSASNNYALGRNSSMSGVGGGGGFPPPNQQPVSDNFLMQDTNRQILLILVRLQQDTNNVLTRLSYLEASIHNIQMNRIETSINSNQVPSAFSLVNSPRASSNTNNRSIFSMWSSLFRNIDWKTVSIAIIWPIIIRLVFYLVKKFRLVIKLRKIKR